MNLTYLKNELIPQRELEIEQGKNLCTADPIYVVLDLVENVVEGHQPYYLCPNERGVDAEFGYIDRSLDSEDIEFSESDDGMEESEAVTRFYTDRFVAFFLTSKGAHDYIEYQRHNLNNPYVYVFNAGYANYEMGKLFSTDNITI